MATRIQTSQLFIALMVMFFSSGNCCNKDKWKCKSGQCVGFDELCDGTIDCKDGSDETIDECSKIVCPTFAFRCAYGACVHGSAQCDNIKNCADNSDESSSLCQTYGLKRI